MKRFLVLFIFLINFSCQPIEKIEQVVFDNSQFPQFDISSKSIEIITIFEKKISDPYIGHTLKVSPTKRIINWVNENLILRVEKDIMIKHFNYSISFENIKSYNLLSKYLLILTRYLQLIDSSESTKSLR